MRANKTAHLENLGITFADPASSDDEDNEYYDEEEDAEPSKGDAEPAKGKPVVPKLGNWNLLLYYKSFNYNL